MFFTFLLILLPLLGYLLFQFSKEYSAVSNERVVKEKALLYWESVITKYPNLPDAYYKAAVYALGLNKKEKALEFLQKAIFLDPEFKEAKLLEKAIR